MAEIAGKRAVNSPTLASIAVFGDQGQWIRGRTAHPTRIWRGIEVDEHLKDEWLEAINSIPDIEPRASCEGHREDGELRPTYLVFRLLPEQDMKAESVAKALSKEEGVYSMADIGSEARPRIVVAAKLAYGDPGWEEFWSGMANRIRAALDTTRAGLGNPGIAKLDVRFGELLIPQDFIRIDSVVRELADTVRDLPEEEAVFSLWDLVCRCIQYPDASPGVAPDRHVLHAFPTIDLPFFGPQYRLVRSNDEWWEFPSEALSWGIANCEGTAVTLCTLLRAYGIGPERVWVVVGEIPPGRHAWVDLDGHILETTLSSAPNPSWRNYGEYVAAWAFNDITVAGEIRFVPKGDEGTKLRWIGALWQHPIKV